MHRRRRQTGQDPLPGRGLSRPRGSAGPRSASRGPFGATGMFRGVCHRLAPRTVQKIPAELPQVPALLWGPETPVPEPVAKSSKGARWVLPKAQRPADQGSGTPAGPGAAPHHARQPAGLTTLPPPYRQPGEVGGPAKGLTQSWGWQPDPLPCPRPQAPRARIGEETVCDVQSQAFESPRGD